MKCIWNVVQHDEKNLLQHSPPPHCLKVLLLIFITLSQKIWTFLKGANCKSTKEEFSSSYSKPEYSMSFNPQNSNSAMLDLKKTWKTCITRAKNQKTWAKFELDTCSNSTVWNSLDFGPSSGFVVCTFYYCSVPKTSSIVLLTLKRELRDRRIISKTLKSALST